VIQFQQEALLRSLHSVESNQISVLLITEYSSLLSSRANKQEMADPRRTGDAEASSIAAGDSVKKHCTRDGRCSGTTTN
jgi:hypothetical protein